MSTCARYGISRTFHALARPSTIVISTWGLCLNSHLPNVFGCNSLTFHPRVTKLGYVITVWWCQRVPSMVTLGPSMPSLVRIRLFFIWGLCLNSHLPNAYGCNSLTFDPRVNNLGPGHQSVVMSTCPKFGNSRTFHALARPSAISFFPPEAYVEIHLYQLLMAVTPWPLTLESPNFCQVIRVWWCQCVLRLVTLGPSMPSLGIVRFVFAHQRLMSKFTFTKCVFL